MTSQGLRARGPRLQLGLLREGRGVELSGVQRTRVWRHGVLDAEGFPCEQVSDLLEESGTVVWLDLEEPTPDDVEAVTREFGLTPLEVEDATAEHERPKLDRLDGHVYLSMYATTLSRRHR